MPFRIIIYKTRQLRCGSNFLEKVIAKTNESLKSEKGAFILARQLMALSAFVV